jgi:hypothetical protein
MHCSGTECDRGLLLTILDSILVHSLPRGHVRLWTWEKEPARVSSCRLVIAKHSVCEGTMDLGPSGRI